MSKPKGSRESRGLLPPGFRAITGWNGPPNDRKMTKLVKYKDKVPPESVLKQFDLVVVLGRGRYHEIKLPKNSSQGKRKFLSGRVGEIAAEPWESPDGGN